MSMLKKFNIYQPATVVSFVQSATGLLLQPCCLQDLQ